jgi:hypothetical protein
VSVFLPAELELLVYWIKQRELVREAKDQGLPKPWTDDPLLRDYRWCNVRRMDDRVSQELLDQWYHSDLDEDEALAAATVARYINWVPTLLEISGGRKFAMHTLSNVGPTLRLRAERGDKVYTGAYMIPGVAGQRKWESIPAVAKAVTAEGIWKRSQRETWEQLIRINGLGTFLAGQIVADIAQLDVGKQVWRDRRDWAPIGPGSRRGMNRLLGCAKEAALSQRVFIEFLPKLIQELRPRIAAIWDDRDLVAMDVQNCLCEFDKFRRLTLREGKVRANYPGKA